eukprot:GHVH01011023.1.p1 GENE.GHVH01011023.1~~GHVH01011023.1.p1  ORF type:complete len:234 (-),score=38.18 GHVH01011023.1:707-1408(-)
MFLLKRSKSKKDGKEDSVELSAVNGSQLVIDGDETTVLPGRSCHMKKIPNLYNQVYLEEKLEEVIIDFMELNGFEVDERMDWARMTTKLFLFCISIPSWYLPFKSNRSIVLLMTILFYFFSYLISWLETCIWGRCTQYKLQGELLKQKPDCVLRAELKLDVESHSIVVGLSAVRWFGMAPSAPLAQSSRYVGELFCKHEGSTSGIIHMDNLQTFLREVVKEGNNLMSETSKDK